MKISLKKVNETTYRISGTVEYLKRVHKSVTVDGVDYFRDYAVDAIVDFDDLWENKKLSVSAFSGETTDGKFADWCQFKTSVFVPFGLPEYSIYYPFGFNYSVLFSEFCASENLYVQLMCALESTGVISGLGYLSYGKFQYGYSGTDEFHVHIDSYGFGNQIRLIIPLHKLLKLSRLQFIVDKLCYFKQKEKVKDWLTRFPKLNYPERIVILSESINAMT